MTPVFAFGTYSILSKVRNTISLDAATAYTSLTIFSLLGQALSTWIDAAVGVATSVGSLERIREYLASNTRVDSRVTVAKRPHVDLVFYHPARDSLLELRQLAPTRRLVGGAEEVVKVRNCNAGWDEGSPTLRNLNFVIKRGDLAMVIGPIGCGKSTLLKAVLGEVPTISGSVVVEGVESAFCDQTAWLTNTSIKDNIVGISEFDPEWYNTVVCACALDRDFSQFPNGDMSMIGSQGIILSGGQKTRVVSEYLSENLELRSDTSGC
jgi:ABC-type multidrug transport system fused ATPase/permease subunit